MTIRTIHLRKLLQFCALDERRTVSALRREAAQDRRRDEAPDEGGGDFFAPFWSDAKNYVTHGFNLHDATDDRIVRNGRRSRLYPILCERFVEWWQIQLRGTNELIRPTEESIHARFDLDNVHLTIKVDNLLALAVGSSHHRLIYPYFCESPPLSPRWARVGLWAMSQALSERNIQEMHILDVQRAQSYSVASSPLAGDEGEILIDRCQELLAIWREIGADV